MTKNANLSAQAGSAGSLVMITGAAGGLGKAFAVECASRGWNLFLTDLRGDLLDILSASLQNTYDVQVMPRACDLTDPVSRTELFTQLQSERLSFWSLVNVAGLDFEGPFYACSRQQIRTILRLNLEGTLEMTHALLELRDPLAPFRVINVASLAAFYPMPLKATYAASKRFLLDFSFAMREELRPLGVTITALCPAGLPTTPECIRAIEAQGLIGQLTTQDVGAVAALTLDAAQKGKMLVIPGLLNQLLWFFGQMIPPQWVASLVSSRWQSAHQKRRAMVLNQQPVG